MRNLLNIAHTWTDAKFGEHAPGLARAMCTCPTLPKRIRAGQSETQTFPGFKTKNTRNFFKIKKIMVKIVCLAGWHVGTPPESGLIRYERPVLLTPKFFMGSSMLLT